MTVAVASKRKKKVSPVKRNYFWDLGMSAGFLLVFWQDITGETLHEWLALALGVGIITHVVFHWKWVVNITKRFFSPKLPGKTRVNYIVNGGLAAAFAGMFVTGLMISESVMPLFGLGNGAGIWEDLHEAASNFSMFMVIAHVLLHWKWVITNTQKYLYKGKLKSNVEKVLPG